MNLLTYYFIHSYYYSNHNYNKIVKSFTLTHSQPVSEFWSL